MVTWTLRSRSDATTVEPLPPPPFVLDPQIVSRHGDLIMPPVEHEPVPRLDDGRLHPSDATRKAIEREYSTFERSHEQLRQLLSSAQPEASSPPIHGPKPDPPARTMAAGCHAARC